MMPVILFGFTWIAITVLAHRYRDRASIKRSGARRQTHVSEYGVLPRRMVI